MCGLPSSFLVCSLLFLSFLVSDASGSHYRRGHRKHTHSNPPSDESIDYAAEQLPATESPDVYAVSSPKVPTSNFVTSLPGLNALSERSWTGYLPTSLTPGQNTSSLFYWFFESRDTPSTDPLVVWIQGGPGCSGLMGAFLELGPYLTLDPVGLTLTTNPNSWNSHANLLIFDQPAGTGFSIISDVDQLIKDEDQLSNQLYNSLLNFFQVFPNLRHRALYLTGESYAGKYIPYLATQIHNQNAQLDSHSPSFLNLSGLAIGDGWTDPLIQTGAYADQAYNVGLLDENEVSNAKEQMENCTKLTHAEKWHEAQVVCDNILAYIDEISGINDDDVREFSAYEPFQTIPEDYLNQPAVQAALQIPTQVNWQRCNDLVGTSAFSSIDEMIPAVQLLPNLYQHYRLILYNGQFDMNCGLVGTEKYLRKLLGDEVFLKPQKRLWFAANDNNRVAGYVRDFNENLTFVIVSGAGHLVPTTQGLHALDILNRLLNNLGF